MSGGRSGLPHDSPDVRRHCVEPLTISVDEDAFPALIEMLTDSDSGVRYEALHALGATGASDRMPPGQADVLATAIDMLRHDPDDHVRAMACEVVGRWVHLEPEAERALVRRQRDPIAVRPFERRRVGMRPVARSTRRP